ncbi:hypothetical protein GALL_430430 [mine drainage metagenome]|uniref:Uncharacterized protein n=1 Tax=mine drainage metagenome TaxID=410659 RepID=A0A1J5QH33_9ZZZZ
MPDAAAADGGQQQMRSFGGQHKANIPDRFFKCFEQGIGSVDIHAFGRKNQDGFAAATGAGALRKLNRLAHGFNTDFLADLALGAINFILRLFTQWPTLVMQHGLRHQYTQIRMGANIDGMTARAAATGPCRQGCITQPGARQRQCQFILTQTRRSAQQPGMAALRQQTLRLRRHPGG